MSSNRGGWLSGWLCVLTIFLVGCGGGGSNTPAPAVGGESLFATQGAEALADSTRTYWQGSLLFMERRDGAEVSRIAIDTARGGFIAEASLNGVNFVNAHDTGRGVQLALYDGGYRYDNCAGCSGDWGWNAVQGGDRYNHGSEVLSTGIDAQGVVIRTRPLQWMPMDTPAPSPSDVVIEQRVKPVPGQARAWRVEFRVEAESSAPRQVALQEFPAVYAGAQYHRLVTYEGLAPWTDGPVTIGMPAPLGEKPIARHSTEHWFALVDDRNEGLALYAPGSYASLSGFIAPGTSGPNGSGTAFARFDSPLAVQPEQVIAGHYYLVVGGHQRARSIIRELMASDEGADTAAPRMVVDRPQRGAVVSGIIDVAGWAYDNHRLASIIVSIDGMELGAPRRGVARPDVVAVHPDAPPDSGFGMSLDTRRLANGPHRIDVIATDAAGHRHEIATEIDVAN
jgi:hypothetical protein